MQARRPARAGLPFFRFAWPVALGGDVLGFVDFLDDLIGISALAGAGEQQRAFLRLRIVSPLTMHFLMSVRDGMSYITSISVSSITVRRPRRRSCGGSFFGARGEAVLGELELDAVEAEEALELGRTSAFFGSGEDAHQRIDVERPSATTIGRRPTNSGIRPYCSRSSCVTCFIDCVGLLLRVERLCTRHRSRASASVAAERFSMILSRPSKAPPQMKRMLAVLIWMNSCCGCLRPPCGGTFATVPSMIFSSACCTPRPRRRA